MIPGSLRSTINLEGFFISSLFLGDRPVGILNANRVDPTQIGAEDFVRFKDCVRELGAGLALRSSDDVLIRTRK